MTLVLTTGRGLALATLVVMTVACQGSPGGGGPMILVVVDTLRADHLGCYGYARATSPELDDWVDDGLLFERAFATAPWTAPSVGSMFTGQLPTRHGVARQERPDGQELFGQLDPGVRTVAEVLTDRGYATAAMVNNPFLSPEFGLDRGFALYDYAPGNNADSRRAEQMVDHALDWIDAQQTSSYFLVVHLFDPHMTYDAPAPVLGRFTQDVGSRLSLPVEDVNAIRSGELALDETDRQFIRAAYDEEIAYVDQALGRLRRALDERGFFEQGLLVLTADHGEELFDHGGFEHGHALWQELLHVPLAFWGRNVTPGRVSAAVSVADVAPTLLRFAGATFDDPIAGHDLLGNGKPPSPSRTLFAEQNLYGTPLVSAIRWPYKVIVNVEGQSHWLFDLATNPDEQMLPWDRSTGRASGLMRQITERVERDLAARSMTPPAELGPETLERLRSLGYVN